MRIGTFVLLILLMCCAALLVVADETEPKEAMYYTELDNKNVQCVLCPRECVIPDGNKGFCRARQNKGGILYTLVYGKPCAVHVDPIEKKPFFHVLPGSRSLSLATAGCNLACKFCQNWQISQASPEETPFTRLSPEEAVALAKKEGCASIAYTYTEPTIFYEYMIDTAKEAKKAGILNVMHSAGFINEKPLRELCPYLDAADIDLKGSDKFYSEMTLGKREDVLRALKILKEEGVWVEVTYLIIPTLNDQAPYMRETFSWIKENLGPETPVHLSRFWPMYKLTNISPTPVATLERAKQIAIEAGLYYVYIGNVPGHEGESTFCPKCKNEIIKRTGYNVVKLKMKDGKCEFCGEPISGVWKKEEKR